MTIEFTQNQIDHIDINPSQNLDTIFLLFLGHAHSGHSIIGAMIDAHPDACITNETNIVKAIHQYQLNKQQVIALLLDTYKTHTTGWQNSEYFYNLNQTHQGVIDKPTLIGDKKAGGSTRVLHNSPHVFDYILKQFGSSLRIIYVARNPVDIIASYAYYMKQPPSMFHVNRFNENYQAVISAMEKTPKKQWLTVSQEAFINTPYKIMLEIYTFLELKTNKDILSAIKNWTSLVRNDLPKKSDFINIEEKLKAQINKKAASPIKRQLP